MFGFSWKLPMDTRSLLLCLGSFLFLFPAFYGNSWHIVSRKWLDHHTIRMECFIVGRMVQSRQHGILSAGGFPGQGSPTGRYPRDPDASRRFQYRAYLEGLDFKSYWSYKSQIGGQGMFFSLLDGLIPLPPQKRLAVHYGVTSSFLVFCLITVVLWFYWEHGLFPALAVLLSLGLSQWLFLFGRDLWWSTWAFYLPMAVLMHYFRRHPDFGAQRAMAIAGLVFLVVFTKCLFNGYEYITSTLIMMVVPLVYYGVLHRWGVSNLNRRLALVATSSILGVALSIGILCLQIGAVKGGFMKGVHHIVYSLEKRTYGNPADFPTEYRESLESSVAGIVSGYLDRPFLTHTTSPYFILRYRHLVVLFLVASAFLFWLDRGLEGWEKRKNRVLVLATWFSLLAPLSWFVIFKAHSYIHTHMNSIVWQMPFTLFGFAVCGSVIQAALPIMWSLVNRRSTRAG